MKKNKKIPVFDIALGEIEKKYINDCLDTSFIGQGPYVKKLEEKFSNFLKGCGYENISVSITEPRIEQDSDHLGDLDDELEDIDEVDNIHTFKRTNDYDGKPSDTE